MFCANILKRVVFEPDNSKSLWMEKESFGRDQFNKSVFGN